MSISIKESTMMECLRKAGIIELPPVLPPGDKRVWTSAVALTRRTNGVESYCLVRNNGDGNPAVTNDFGPCAAIHSYIAIHPIGMLDEKSTPAFKSNKEKIDFLFKAGHEKKDIQTLLNRKGKTAEQIAADNATVEAMLTAAAVEFANEKADEDARCREMRDYAERIKFNNDNEEE